MANGVLVNPDYDFANLILCLLFEQSIVLSFIYGAMFIVCFYDRFMGIFKSRKAGVVVSSSKDRKGTGGKIMIYFSLLFIATMIDLVQIMAVTQWEYQMNINLPQVPIFTIAIWEGVVEWKSIYETFEEKEKSKMEDAARILAIAIKNKDFQSILLNNAKHIKDDSKTINELENGES